MRLLRGVYEGPGSHGILRVAASMRGVHAVLRATPEEGYFSTLYGAWTRSGEPAPVSLSPLWKEVPETSRVPGNLRRDLSAIARRHPEAEIVLLARSETALLAEEPTPLTSLPENPETGRMPRLISYEWESPTVCEIEAADRALEDLVRACARRHEKSPSPTVNVFGPPIFNPGAAAEVAEIERLLGLLGIGVNARVPLGADARDLDRISRAWANVVLYREVGDAATLYLQDEFGTPRVTTPMIGAAGTGAVLRAVGEICDLDPSRVRRALWTDLARTAKLPWYARLVSPEALEGRRAAIFGDFTYVLGLGYALAREFGLEASPCGTYLKHLERDFLFHASSFTDDAFVADDPEEVAARIKKSDPDILIGTHLEEEVADSLEIPFLPFCPPVATHPFTEQPIMGYAGSSVLADALEYALDRTKVRPETTEPTLLWTEEALEELEEIPAFLRGRARRLAEERARERRSPEVTREILEESRL